MAWIKLKAIESTIVGCVSCGPKPKLFPPTSIIAVGFGSATLLKGNELVWDEQQGDATNKYMTGAEAEKGSSRRTLRVPGNGMKPRRSRNCWR